MKINVTSWLYCAVNSEVDIPVDNWAAIKDWYVKWDALHYTLDGETWAEVELNSDTTDGIDWKRPTSVEIQDEEFETVLGTYER